MNDRHERTQHQSRRPTTVAIANVTVHTMAARGTLQGQTVVIEDGRISRMGRVGEVPTAGFDVVDGTGRYLMPGLTDMHAHLFAPTDLNLYLANGVTLIRDLWGSPLRLAMRDLVARGDLLGPRIVAGSPIIDGDLRDGLPVIPTNEVVTDAVTAAAVAERFVDRGYDQLKTYSILERDALRAVVEVGRLRGVIVTGHCPRSLTMEEAADVGQQCFEHLLEIGSGHLVDGAPWPPRSLDRQIVTARHLDLAAVERLGAKLARDGVWNCPTVIASERILVGRFDPDDPYTPPDMLEWWASEASEGTESAQAIVKYLQRVVRILHRVGAPLLIGADPTNTGVRTGFSVHEELEHFRRAGLSTLDVLRCATVQAARFLGQEAEWGTVAERMRADLVLTDADPVADLSTLRHPRAVLCNGDLFGRDTLDRLLVQRINALGEPRIDAALEGGVEMRQGRVVVARGISERRAGQAGRTEILERHAIAQMGLSTDRSSSIVLDRNHTVVSASVTDQTSIGQSTFQVDRTKEGYRLVRRDLDGWEESAVIESPPLHPSNRLSSAAFAFALQALAGSKPGSVIDLPIAGPLEEAIAPIVLRATRQGLALAVRRHGERSPLAAKRRGDGSVRIKEDRFHGRFVTIVR
jgi:imidazolonepropionase-like amidohydrolase